MTNMFDYFASQICGFILEWQKKSGDFLFLRFNFNYLSYFCMKRIIHGEKVQIIFCIVVHSDSLHIGEHFHPSNNAVIKTVMTDPISVETKEIRMAAVLLSFHHSFMDSFC